MSGGAAGGPSGRRSVAWTVLAAVVVAALVVAVVEPLRALVAEASRADGGVFAFFGETGARGPQSLGGTLVLSVASVGLAGLVGTALAVALHGATFPGRRAIEIVAPLGIALPPLIGSFAFLVLLDRGGILPRAVKQITGSEPDLTGMTGVLVVHVHSFAPFFYLLVRAALTSLDGSRAEAARSLGAGPARAFVSGTLPQLLPALGAASLLVFLASAGSFTAPMYFAPDQPIATLAIWRAHGRSLPMAASGTVALAATTLAVLGLLFLLRRHAAEGTSKGVPPAPRPLRGVARFVAAAIAFVVLAFFLLPHLAVLLLAFHDPRTWTTQVLPPDWTLRNFGEAFGSAAALAPLWTSLWTSVLATAAAVVLGLACAALVVSRRVPMRTAIALLAVAPMALPGTALAINLLAAYGRGSWLLAGASLSGTTLLLPLAYFARTLPLTYQGAEAGLRRLPPDLAAAARSLGASPATAFRTVVLPALAPSLVAAGLLAFVTSLGEFVASVLLFPAGSAPLAVHVDQLYRATNAAAVPAAYGTLLVALAAGASLLSSKLAPPSA